MDKRKRVLAAFENQVPDRTPAAFWFHHSLKESAKSLADQQIQLYRQTDMDYIKIMYDLEYSLDTKIDTVSDWYHIKPKGKNSAHYQKQLDIIRRVLDAVEGECVVLDTTFSPLRHAVWLLDNSNEKLLEHARTDIEALRSGVLAIAQCMAEWMQGFLEAGVDGVFYAAQYGEAERFSDEEWERLVKSSDSVVLKEIRRQDGKKILLHPCGQPIYQHKVKLERYREYPRDMINWDVHANSFSLEEGRKFFDCPVMGGLDNKGPILGGDEEKLQEEFRKVLSETNPRGFILGTDCSLPGTPSFETLHRAMELVKAETGSHSLIPKS